MLNKQVETPEMESQLDGLPNPNIPVHPNGHTVGHGGQYKLCNLYGNDSEIIDYIGLLVTVLLHRMGHHNAAEPDQFHVRNVVRQIVTPINRNHLAHLHAMSMRHNVHLPAAQGENREKI